MADNRHAKRELMGREYWARRRGEPRKKWLEGAKEETGRNVVK